MNHQHPFETLTPSFVINAVESQGYLSDGRLLALNSYENRVYQVGIEEQTPVIAKFYRPERWTRAQIQEEHDFSAELLEQELSVVAPWRNDQQQSLFDYEGFLFAIYPRQGGYAPELDNEKHLEILGRTLGRLHAIGSTRDFQYRQRFDIQRMGADSIQLISAEFIPSELKSAYNSLTQDLLAHIERQRSLLESCDFIRVHGDCHVGNVLWRDDIPHFVDFDDAIMAPAIQDLWMLLSGDAQQQRQQMDVILRGYDDFFEFDDRQIHLIETLRTLRILHYSAWLARRWQDPAFPHSFPWFNSVRYWSDHILQLREQLSALHNV
jgi:hypothetical protein